MDEIKKRTERIKEIQKDGFTEKEAKEIARNFYPNDIDDTKEEKEK